MAANRRASRRRNTIRVVAFLGVVGALFAVGQLVDVAAHVSTIRAWVAELGVAAPAVYTLAYAVATLLGVPGTPLTVLAALVFGPRQGVVVMIIASTIAAFGGFAIARWLARDRIERLLGDSRPYQALQSMLDASPVVAVPFARLMPVFPFSLVNYALGLSRMPLWKYLLTSELVMVPMNFVWVWSATAVYGTVIRGDVPWGIVLGTLGGALALLVVGVIGHRAFGSPEREGSNAQEAVP